MQHLQFLRRARSDLHLMPGGDEALAERPSWRGSVSRVLHHPPALHHETYFFQRLDVLQRIALDGDEIRLIPRRDRADPIAESERLRGERSGGDDRRHRILPAPLHAIDELLKIASV